MTDSPSRQRCLRIGTRGSQLALWQAEWTARKLQELGQATEIVTVATLGDDRPDTIIGGLDRQGVFTNAIQRALLSDEIDLAVHSLKDLPTAPLEGLSLASVPKRESPADVLVCRSATSLDDLEPGARVGTGSLRRQSQLLHARPDLKVEPIRGNVETRLHKLDEGQFEAILLAEAGLRRLGLAGRITQVLPYDQMLPAVGQGALGLECRSGDAEVIRAITPLDDRPTHLAVLAERSLLAHLRGGCLAPIGALAEIAGDRLCLSAVVLSHDGSQRLFHREVCGLGEAEDLGCRVADQLLAQGAAQLISAARDANSG
jgi:hydroxymethylbilane synthase